MYLDVKMQLALQVCCILRLKWIKLCAADAFRFFETNMKVRLNIKLADSKKGTADVFRTSKPTSNMRLIYLEVKLPQAKYD